MLALLAQATDTAPSAEEKLDTAMEEASGTISAALEGDTDALWTLFEGYGMPVVWALIILIASVIVGKILCGTIQRAAGKARLDETLSRFFGKLVYYVIVLVGVTFALGKFGIPITSFAAILAAAGFAIGMAFSGTLSNFAAGAMLLFFRPFKVGDVVNAGGVIGKVHEIELFTTTLDTPDNRRIIVPNSGIYGSNIENITHHPHRRVDVAVGVAYDADLDKTREVLCEACRAIAGEWMVDGEGRGFQVYLVDLGDSAVNWAVRMWGKTEEYWDVREHLTRSVKRHLDEAGLGIPFPQMDVHIDGTVKRD